MKQFQLYPSVLVLISLLFSLLLASCTKDEKPECCNGFGVVEKKYDTIIQINGLNIPINGEIKIYTAMTPLNKPYCDSLVWDETIKEYQFPYDVLNPVTLEKDNEFLLCDPVEALAKYNDGCRNCCPCRENPDEQYNNYNDVGWFNDIFTIYGIYDFPSNKLLFRIPGDTTIIKQFDDYGTSTSTVFEGQVDIDSTMYGRNPIPKMLHSGKYEYELILYTDSTKSILIDNVIGNFCIIRTPDFENEGCIATEDGDPLINQ